VEDVEDAQWSSPRAARLYQVLIKTLASLRERARRKLA